MEPTVTVFWVPKKGNSFEEYEDAYSCDDNGRYYAIADGATESSFSEIWAQVLTRQFVDSPPGLPPQGEAMESWLVPLQKEWHANIMWDRLPWYAEEKARMGAFAALLGIRFLPPVANETSLVSKVFFMFQKAESYESHYQAVAVGDCNLFIVRNNTLVTSFPMEKSEHFNSRPMLLGSNPSKNKGLWNEMKFLEGTYEQEDLFILGSDAIAKWFLERCEAGSRPWHTLSALKNDSDFATFVAGLRDKSQIRNDDTTVMILQWKESKESTDPK